MKELKLKVEMHCKSCELVIKDILTDAGVEVLEISAPNNSLKVRYDENKIKESKIKELIKKEGYKLK